MKRTAQILILISALLFSLFAWYSLFFRQAKAQTQTFTAIPPRLELKVKPGEFVQKTIQFRNEGDEIAYLSIVPKDFIVEDAAGTPRFVDSLVSGRWAASTWIKTLPESLVVAPKQIASITLSINVPLDALPGGHYAGILYQGKGSPQRIGTGIGAGAGIQQVVGTLVYLTVEGPVTEKALVKRFEIPKFLEFGPVPVLTEILNQSNLHITPKGQITIKDMFGKTKAVLPLEERNIFPGASLVYQTTWNTKYLIGRYRADLAAAYGSQGHALTATLYFVVFPVKIALAVILAIVIIILVVLLIRKKKKEETEKSSIQEKIKEEIEVKEEKEETLKEKTS